MKSIKKGKKVIGDLGGLVQDSECKRSNRGCSSVKGCRRVVGYDYVSRRVRMRYVTRIFWVE